ncbi:ankyrin repeat protein [Anaeramoeba ignava]|uniref:Ankyrin repeat protein n=1 Tax=Anaeramoeba ignava TaxID=1746090 RepID=A0A9Q0RFF0_ANAIG|nr:ankyrin repeat protein [Anaeramoeba ignava]
MDILEAITQNDLEYLKSINNFSEIDFTNEIQGHFSFNEIKEISFEMIELLMKKGMNPNLIDDSGINFLHFAIRNSLEIKSIILLIEKGIDINAKTNQNETSLHFACRNQNISFEVTKLLIEKGVDINAKTNQNETALHFACRNQNISFEVTKLLIEKGADINSKTNYNETALHFACKNQNMSFEVTKLLIEKGADINIKNSDEETALHNACRNRKIPFEIIKLLVENGADINAKTCIIDLFGFEEYPALHYAYWNQPFQVVQYLLEKGANVNNTGNDGTTILHSACGNNSISIEHIEYLIQKVLHLACQNNSLEIIKYLVEKGVDINAKTNDNETVLHLACQNNSIEIIKYLVEKGVDINAKTNNNETVLHLACQNNSLEIIKYLVEKGIDINAKTNENETVIHLACQNNSIEIIKYLVEKGIDINAKTTNNETVLHLACQNNSIEIIKYLVEKGVDINAKTNENETVLHLACRYKNSTLEIIKYLVEKGIDINAKTNKNETPLHYLAEDPFHTTDIFEYLIENGADANIKNSKNKTPFLMVLQSRRQTNRINLITLLKNDSNFYDLKYSKITLLFAKFFKRIYSLNEDMNNLLRSDNNFSDYRIESNDSAKFWVHKLILLTRFDNNESILQKFIQTCQQKSKEIVQYALNFLYTGFIDFGDLIEKMDQIIANSTTNSNTSPKEKKDKQLISEGINQKQEQLDQFFKEVGFDSNWIQSKKGRKGIIKDFSKLYQQESTKDFTIIFEEEKKIKVHKLILILRSELFKGMFQLNVQDSSNQVHDYSGKSFETIHQLIYFFYHDEFEKETNKFPQEIKKEFDYFKDYYQLNPNSIIGFPHN